MKQLVVIFTLWLVWMPVGAQKTLTLEECLKLGIENNLSLEGSRNEMRKPNICLARIVRNCGRKSVRWRVSMTILIHRYLSPTGQPMEICTM